MRLSGKVAIITGAARGIGAAAAYLFAENGAKVTLCDLDSAGLEKVAGEIKAKGGEALICEGNIADRAFVEQMVKDTVEKLGGLDILVNNAGITRDAMGHKMTEEQWDQVIDVNLKGSFNCLQACMIYMRGQGSGSIINLSSISRYGNPGQLNYAASKAGVVGLTRTAARELARKNVRVNCVAPGFINTEMLQAVPKEILEAMTGVVPMGRLGTPKETAELIMFLASDESSFITGQTINIDGGTYVS